MKTLPVAVLVLAVSWACGSSPIKPDTPDGQSPAPQEPAPTLYQVSGAVIDENGSAVTNASVEVIYPGPDESQPTLLYTTRVIRTQTGADGRYNVSFEARSPRFLGNANVIGMVRSRNDTQLLPGGVADIVRDLHYHHVPTIDAGGSIAVSIEPDSSRLVVLAASDFFKTSNPFDLNRLRETFRIVVGGSGTLTVGVQSGIGATLQAHCSSGPEECGYVTFTQSSGSISGHVQAGTIYEVNVSIPSAMAPQRYELTTSLTQ